MARARSSRSHVETDHYLHFVKTVHLEDVALESANFEINRGLFVEQPKSPEPESGRSALLSARQQLLSLSHESFSVKGDFKVQIKSVTGKDAVKIVCTFMAQFSIEKEAEEEQVKRFVENEVRVVFWPYLRQFVSDVTSRMSIPPLVLPLTSELKGQSHKSD